VFGPREDEAQHQEQLARLSGLTPVRRRSTNVTSPGSEKTRNPDQLIDGDAAARQRRALETQHALAKERQAARQLELDLKYTADHVKSLIIPVSLTMLAVVATVKAVTSYSSKESTLAYTPYENTGCEEDEETGECKETDDSDRLSGALLNVLIVIVILIVMTFALVICFKKKWYRAMNAFLILSTLMITGYIFYTFMTELLSAQNTVMSWPTLAFIIWQFMVGGMLAIHYKAPLRVRQFYLIAVSVLMALVFIKLLPDWTAWILLGAVACYDLVAVLCPCGPLNMLIEEVQASGRDFLPELVYSSTIIFPVSMMADSVQPRTQQGDRALNQNLLTGEAAARQRSAPQKEEEEEDTGVKLGLGDFIFYSVLVGKAATKTDWSVVFACYMGIIVGLCLTIFILAIFQRPLPALPISIFLALIFYFTTSITLSEYLGHLTTNELFI